MRPVNLRTIGQDSRFFNRIKAAATSNPDRTGLLDLAPHSRLSSWEQSWPGAFGFLSYDQ
ncbi:MAG: hypothetical protein EA377_03445 [Phycisphaerales bacterium]|nr:MAG: hypothetical protein EA377_03445 [Phycisphaerales bacterium]